MNRIGIGLYETKRHGTENMPFAVYLSKIPEKLDYYPMHWHEEMEIIYVESGECLVTIDGKSYHAKKDELIFISPGMIHAIDQVEKQSSTYYNILFHPDLLINKEEKDEITLNYLKPLLRGEKVFSVRIEGTEPAIKEISLLVHKLISKRRKLKEEGQGFLVKSALFELLYHLGPYLHSSDQRKTNLHQIAKMKELTEWLNVTLADNIKLEDAAEFCGYSKSYFTKFFRNYTGSSFVAYKNLIRLEKAKTLLEKNEFTGLEVADLCGYENYSYFIRAFRKLYEITPKQYQMKMSSGLHG